MRIKISGSDTIFENTEYSVGWKTELIFEEKYLTTLSNIIRTAPLINYITILNDDDTVSSEEYIYKKVSALKLECTDSNPDKYHVVLLLTEPSLAEEIQNLKTEIGIIDDPKALSIDEMKKYMIRNSKAELQKYLSDHPLHSTCHNNTLGIYSITEDKQALMTSNYFTYQIDKQLSPDTATLTWNETGDVCETWTEAEFLQLISEVKSIVKELVTTQQTLEKDIMSCNTIVELNKIVIDYAKSDIRNGDKNERS